MAALATPPPQVPASPAAPSTSGPVAAPAAQPGQTVESALDSAFAHAASPAPVIPPDPAAPVVTSPEPVTDPATPQTAAAPVVDTLPVTEPAPPELDFTDGVQPDSVSEDGKRHFYNPTKSQRLQQAAKFVQAVQNILPNATVDEIKDAVEVSHAAKHMMLRFHEGASDPAAVDEVIDAFKMNENPQAFGMLAVRMLNHLPQIEPGAAQFIKRHYNQGLINDLKQTARQTVDQAARDQTIALIQCLQIQLSGNAKGYEPKAAILGGGNADPIAIERAEVERGRREIHEFQQRQQQSAQQQVANTILNAQQQGSAAEIDAILAPVKAAYADATGNMKPEWRFIRQEFADAVDAAEQAHPEWRVKLDNLRTEAMLKRSEQSLQNFANYWRSIVRAVARPNSKAILDRWGHRSIQLNQAANDKANSAAANEPAPNGVASLPSSGIKIDDAIKAKGYDAVFKAMGW